MSVFDKIKKKKAELELPTPPPPPPPENLLFPEIPQQSIPEPEPIPIIDTTKDFKALSIPEPREIHFKPSKPVFISLSDFKKINDNLLKIRSIVEEANDFLVDLEKLYENQHKTMLSWIKELESVEKKISLADEIISNHEKK